MQILVCIFFLIQRSNLSTGVASNVARSALQQMAQNPCVDLNVYMEFSLISKYTVQHVSAIIACKGNHGHRMFFFTIWKVGT